MFLEIIWIVFHIIAWLQINTIDTASIAVCFLTVRPASQTLLFAEELALDGLHYDIDVFVMVDDNSYTIQSSQSSIVTILQIPNQQCITNGYHQLMYVDSRPINVSSWDKSLFYFCKLNTNYSFVWLIEDDVFIPSVDAFRVIHQLYWHTSDLVVKHVDPNLSGERESWAHWHLAYGKLVPPWFKSMVNAVGLSRRLLETVNDYIRWRGDGTYHEYLLQTLSFNQNMTVVSPIELDTLVWGYIHSWEDIKKKANNWWHPVKNLTAHTAWRRRLVRNMDSNLKKNSRQWFQLKPVCNNHDNSTIIESRLHKLVVTFNQNKIYLSSEERRSLRQHFLCLAQQCQTQEDFKSASMIMENLADNTYKLPEPKWTTINNKSLSHLIIEKELLQNKQYIFQFFEYIDVIKWFREVATNLTMMLTNEIQREMKQIKLQPKTKKLVSLQINKIDTATVAVCFLTVRPASETLLFAEELALDGLHYDIDVFVMIPNQQCITDGYQQTMYINSRPINISSWDKNAFRVIHQLYWHTSDLVVKRMKSNMLGELKSWDHWYMAHEKIPPPWFNSMTNGVGLSRRLLDAIRDFIGWRGISTFHEYLLQTLSMHLNMTVVTPIEFDTLSWKQRYSFEDIKKKANNWWHPVKNLTAHTNWRRRLVRNMNSNLKKNSRQWFKLKPVCNNHDNSTTIESRLQKLVVTFNQNKIYLSSEERRSLRQHFLCLAQQCQTQEDFKSASMIMENLADNTYKLPERRNSLAKKMSHGNTIRIPFRWPNVNVFTFGKSSLYGYDSSNHCLFVQSSIQFVNTTDIAHDCLHFSSSPKWPIRKLILNEDETSLALLADKTVYLVYLPQSNSDKHHYSPSKGSHLCPIFRVPPPLSSSTPINCSLIDFVWLTSNHFIIVYSAPSSSNCHLYSIRSSRSDGVEYLHTFSVGGIPSNTQFNTPSKKISLHQPSDIIKLDMTKRQTKDSAIILLFAMKTDGDIFLMEIDENQLLNNHFIDGEFRGPIPILPSTFDNYGVSQNQSTLVCLAKSACPLVIFTPNRIQLHQCIILSPSRNQHHLFTIDCLSFPNNQPGQIITSIVPDRFISNKYYITDSNANIYVIEISWIDQIQQGSQQLQSTKIQHLIKGENSNNKIMNEIEQLSSIQIDNDGYCLAVIVKTQTTEEKELILIRSQLSNSISNSEIIVSEAKSSEFLLRLRSILARDQTIPFVTLRSSTINISDFDLEKNVLQYIKIFTEQYIQKQEKVRQEIDNKQRYLAEFYQTHLNENKQLNDRFQQIQNQFQTLSKQYQQECLRRKRLSSRVSDLLSTIEQSIPVLSDEEIRMQQQLESYQVQIDCLRKQIEQIQEFISFNQNQDQLGNTSMENMQNFVRNHRNQIDQMKQQLENIQTHQ
ncbi:hypothetical protein I4U23_003465 [Adineta vaga]|nr:hypothetical protein I4U23_003465 [Adineta vaga]